MKKILFILMLILALVNLSAQEYIKISGLSITQINQSQIKANLKIEELFGTAVYNSFTTQVDGNIITLKVCYEIYTFDGGETVENNFDLNIPSNPGNYTFNVEIFVWGSNGCFHAQNKQDSATLDFTNPFTGTISLSTNDVDSQNKNLNLYPNPVNDILNFSEEVVSLKITDLSGKILKQNFVAGKSIDVSKLPKGNYLATITTKKGEVISKKFIKN